MVRLGFFWLLTQAAIAQGNPNIIYILLDDAGFGDIGCYGQTHFSTPNIDRLASEGMRFTQHYSGSTVCAPTRCVLMTGLHTGHAWVRGNREVRPEGQAPMPQDVVTVPRLLAKAGYRTGAFGKWGLGAPGSESEPMEHFQRFYGYNCQREAHTYYPDHLWSDRQRVELDGKTYAHDLIMDEALAFIRENKKGPFFTFLPVTIPHAAMHVPDHYKARFADQFSAYQNDIGKYRGPEVTNPVAAFAGMMTKLDEGIGQLLDLLRELEIDDNTVVMFSSDNGPHREGGHRPDVFDSNGPFRGHKRDLYEGGIRVPLLARWPGRIKAGSVSDHLSAHWDMLPTFCQLAGTAVPPGLDGISFLDVLEGGAAPQTHRYLYWEFYEQGGRKAVRFGDWKAVQLGLAKNPDAPIELYNLQSDPGETVNLAKEHRDLVNTARGFLKEAHTDSPLWSFQKRKPRQR